MLPGETAMTTLRAATPVPRIHRPGVETFRREIARAARPVVITGALEDWPARRLWSARYFRERFGASRVPVYAMRGGGVRFDPRKGLVSSELTVAAFVDQLEAREGERFRMRCPLPDALPEAASELRVPAYCEGALALRSNLWFSGPDTVTALHFDLPDNLLAQVAGRKRFLLFGPEQSSRLYRHSLRSATPQFSQVDLGAPDLARFPRLADAQPMEARLEPGDLLYIPSRWWHYAESPDVTLSVSYWWARPVVYPAILAVDVLKRLRGLTR